MGHCMSCFKDQSNGDVTASHNRDKDGKLVENYYFERIHKYN